MKAIIVEDEPAAAKRLKKLLLNADPKMEILKIIDSVEGAIDYLSAVAVIDIIFLDVQLADGLCFEIFDAVRIDCPVIFTTAYDEYAIKAFELNSIYYLLKPINQNDLEKGLRKFQEINGNQRYMMEENIDALLHHYRKPEYKTRFLIKTGESLYAIRCSEIRYILIDSQIVNIVNESNKRFIVDYAMDELEEMLDPRNFFRINRQMIISFDAIKSIHTYFNSRLILKLSPDFDRDVIVSREKVLDFKKWLDR
jgi:two-component system, LytTR family, response regulator LytT